MNMYCLMGAATIIFICFISGLFLRDTQEQRKCKFKPSKDYSAAISELDRKTKSIQKQVKRNIAVARDVERAISSLLKKDEKELWKMYSQKICLDKLTKVKKFIRESVRDHDSTCYQFEGGVCTCGAKEYNELVNKVLSEL